MEPMIVYLRIAFAEVRHGERGAIESAQIFAWIAVTVGAIVLLGGMMEALGVDVINWVRGEIGL